MSEIINCLDLKKQHQQIKEEIFSAFEKVYDYTAFSGGHFVEDFENAFSTYTNSKYCIGLNNGTSALHLAMLALGIKDGDEVIIPANTFIATAWGVSHCGATPVFVDCDKDTWEIDATKIAEKISPKTKAIIGVDLYGMPFDIDTIKQIANKHNLFLVEDAAQAQGSKYKGKIVGDAAEMACFSFYPGKNLGACGEAGGITTNNESYYKHLQSLRNHGSQVRYYHDEIGYNMRMGGLEGASLQVKLKYLDSWNNRRREIAKMYFKGVTNPVIKMQYQPEWAESNFHLFVVTTEQKNDFVKYLQINGINPAFHYPVPCHLQKAYAYLRYKKGDFPNSEYLADHCVSLPMYAELTNEQVEFIIDKINRY
jgi:dTDP-4-amino-4,6-dideoxygalactose transaminase